MALTNVNIDIVNGGLGIQPGTGSGVICKVGVASKGEVGQIVAITDKLQAKDAFGTGTLVNALADSLIEGKTIYAVRAQGDIEGTLSGVTASKSGTGLLTVEGKPLDAYAVVVNITDTGTLNTAAFKYSLDNGNSFSPRITVPAAQGRYELPGTGLTLVFAQGTQDLDNSFMLGDNYTFTATAPSASIGSINAAIDKLLETNLTYEGIHVTGASDPSLWVALDTRAREAEKNFRYIYILAEAKQWEKGQDTNTWMTELLTQAETFASDRVGVCAAFAKITDALTGSIVERNLAGIIVGRIAMLKIQESAGKVILGSLPGVVSLLPENLNDGHIEALDNAKFTTARRYEGLNGNYVTEFRMMGEATSDYQYGEYRRAMDKACKLVRTAALKFKNYEASEEGIAALQAHLEQPVNIMVGDGEITSGSIVIPEGQDILATSRLKVKIRIVPVGIMRSIDIEIGLHNPFLSGGEAV